MKHLHAYWRIDYIEAPKVNVSNDDLFSNLANTKNDEDALVLFRSTHCFIVLNRYPYNAGHLLIAPYRPMPELKDLSPPELLDLMNMIIKAQDILTQALKPNGFNIGFNIGTSAGAGIPKHIHCHVVPRWEGDTNFMPVLTNTKVLPQSLHAMWERLRKFTA
ncbi:MAG: HIT family hydrolase [Verrucomicrobia bacterium]|nr:MAG: HIT family hydrolase [Verrucomicrobiota bacterium]